MASVIISKCQIKFLPAVPYFILILNPPYHRQQYLGSMTAMSGFALGSASGSGIGLAIAVAATK
ncbi:hypothetical protein BDV41DRAFT_546342 [Aspergillus transmontanensis]|uniref:Uncharacterized protein n=1 Tax=Aspergillus transmontanensis TaxID=1034304 RepID=A0A5N6VNK3_9EURO|nr:hypothetical protein BDV41DRAFT_546342 [Aspergillus transmontanensis]